MAKRKMGISNDTFLRAWITLIKMSKINIEPEYKFNPVRRWRFDYAIIKYRIAIEVEGGCFIQGRHSRGVGMIKDMAKYNTAVMSGWRVLRYTPQTLIRSIEDIKCIIKGRQNEVSNILT